MPLNPTYSAGTVSVTAGGTTVTGNLTLWLAAGIREGDVFECRGLTATIASVSSSTSITLVRPWFGATVTGSEYEIRYIADASRVIGAARTVVERFEASQPLFDGAYASYENLLDVVPTLAPTVRAIKAVVGGTETRWVRDASGAALGGGWAPADMPLPQNYGGQTAASLAAAVADNPSRTVEVNFDPSTIPTDYRGVLLEHTVKSRNRNFAQTAFSVNQSYRIMRAAAGEHPDRTESAFHTEMLAWGSTKNGPASATLGNSIYIAKRGYSGGSAVGGEIDGLEIFLRQDGPDGLPSAAAGSSDAAALMVNAQNIGTCGFVAVMDASVSNVARTSGFPLDVSMQVQSGVIDANNAQGKVSFGHVAVMRAGAGRTAFHAGVTSTGTWENLFDSPNLRGTWGGELHFRSTANYTDYGGRIARPTGLNSQLSIENRGNLGIALRALDAGAITLATGGSNRWQLSAAGNWQPVTDLGTELGNAARRIGNTHTNALVVYGNTLTLSGLPTFANNAAAVSGGLAVGRVYKTATGELRIVV